MLGDLIFFDVTPARLLNPAVYSLSSTVDSLQHFGFSRRHYREDSLCVKDDQQGVCRGITVCESAKRELAMKKQPQICFFKGLEPVVCCFDDAPSAATPNPPGATAATTEKDSGSYDYEYTNNNGPSDGCEPIPTRLTSEKTGSKAWDSKYRSLNYTVFMQLSNFKPGLALECIEYQDKYVYPCEKRLALSDGKVRMNYCGHEPDELHAGGKPKLGQFPHMVLLGYGNDTATATWLCGGTIISKKFVLTAAHCSRDRLNGEVKYIRTATVKRSDPLEPKRTFRIARILLHPKYRSPRKYNDIALLESHTEIVEAGYGRRKMEVGSMQRRCDRCVACVECLEKVDVETEVKYSMLINGQSILTLLCHRMLIDRFAMPACLPVGDTYNDSSAVAIGFGAAGFHEEASDSMQKVSLNKFSTEDCSKRYPPTRHTDKGFQESSQMCYGHKTKARDTCQGDSGGPLQIANEHVHCMYTIVGIISYGLPCGIVGVPGIYTRVANYVPWIETTVWPD
ncbi:Serine protease snake [Eumeta japonica]|uniref:Serine protease snake n=1 Tax=Eumeta variegata TaxID=151549 RepID=A0A4C1ZSM1_EUMVA|nr:Serine protease snake [Eumeta japonica]